MGTYPPHDQDDRELWAQLRAQVQNDPVPTSVVVDAYDCLERIQDAAADT
jgi:hypothetical protein